MLTRKLLKNFILQGKMTTTEKKIKVVKEQVEKLVHFAKRNTEATRILIRGRLADKKVEEALFKYVAPVFKDKISGFTTLTHLTQRDSDGAAVARINWSLPVVLEKPVRRAKVSKLPVKSKKDTPQEDMVSGKTKKV